ncbi:MAG: site-2 protease family protein [Thermoanaerobaculia bacterium]
MELNLPQGLPESADRPTTQPSPEPRGVWKLLSGSLVVLGLLALKLKALVIILFGEMRLFFVNPFEGFGAAQFAWTGGSMLASVIAYAVKMRLPFAVGFVVVTVIHELGHAVMIRRKGLRAGAIVFIPFVGGAVTLKDQPHSAFDDAQIGLAGPIAGAIASLVSLWIYDATGNPLYLAISFAGFILNLFNLLPLGPLDGGKISAAITKWTWVLGGLILLALMLIYRSPILSVIVVLSVIQVYRAIREERNGSFYDVRFSQRLAIAVVYFLLVALLVTAAMLTYGQLAILQGR